MKEAKIFYDLAFFGFIFGLMGLFLGIISTIHLVEAGIWLKSLSPMAKFLTYSYMVTGIVVILMISIIYFGYWREERKVRRNENRYSIRCGT